MSPTDTPSDSETNRSTAAGDSALTFFQDRFDLDEPILSSVLDTALERAVDYADLYFEYTTQDSVGIEEGIVKSGSRHLEQGVGVRALCGERQGYAHSDEINPASMQLAADTARSISQSSGDNSAVAVGRSDVAQRNLYPVAAPHND